MAEEGTRIERDSMGEVKVPSNAYYGASTERARQNFPISNLRMPRRFIRALAQIKGAAALVNAELGLLETRLANPIQQAAEDVEGLGEVLLVMAPVRRDSPCHGERGPGVGH